MNGFCTSPAIHTLCLVLFVSWTATSAQEGATATDLRQSILRAGQLYQQGDYEGSAQIIAQVQTELASLLETATAEQRSELRPVYNSLRKAHGLLVRKEMSLPPLAVWSAASSASSVPRSDTERAPPKGVRFTTDVAPILMAKCGRCHIRANKGGLGLGSYAAVMRGSAEAGAIVFPGDDAGSRMIEVIESGDMPRGGLQVSPDEFALLRQWIREGAKFDGNDPNAAIAAGGNDNNVAPLVMSVDVSSATGNETVSFTKDLAPILTDQCIGCHNSQGTAGGLDATSLASLLAGGDSGAVVSPGDSAASLLIGKLEGTADGRQMPRGRPPLPPATIEKFKTWIAEGAKFDGPPPLTPQTPVANLSDLIFAATATIEQFTQRRAELARKHWHLALPDQTMNQTESEHFLLLGQTGTKSLDEIAKLAEEELASVRKVLKIPAADSIPRGRVTLFVLDKRYDYAEFGAMVEGGPLPKDWLGHWRSSPIDAYGVVVRSAGDLSALRPILAEIVAGNFVAGIKNSPTWLSLGTARWYVSITHRRDERVLSWDSGLVSVAQQVNKPEDLIGQRLSPEALRLASYGVVRMLAKDRGRFLRLWVQLQNGTPADQAFSQVYGATPAQVVSAWKASGGS